MYPQLAATLEPTEYLITLGDAATVSVAISACSAELGVPAGKRAAQLWWYSTLNQWLRARIAMMLEMELVPSGQLEQVFATAPGSMWWGLVTAVAEPGETPVPDLDDPWWQEHRDDRELMELAAGFYQVQREFFRGLRGCAEVVGGLGVSHNFLALTAVDVSLLAGCELGQEAYEHALGAVLGWVSAQAAAAEFGVSAPAFEELLGQDEGGQLRPLAELTRGELDLWRAEPLRIIPPRSTCCMVVHNPNAGMCGSCPAQGKQARLARMLGFSE